MCVGLADLACDDDHSQQSQLGFVICSKAVMLVLYIIINYRDEVRLVKLHLAQAFSFENTRRAKNGPCRNK